MAAANPGSMGNVEWGFTAEDSDVIKIDSTNVGFLEGDITVSFDQEEAFLELDQAVVDLDGVVVKRNLTVSFALAEVLLVNLQRAWNNSAESGGVLSVGTGTQGTVDLDITISPPNDDGTNDSRVINIPRAFSIGPSTYTVPLNAKQSVDCTFKALANNTTGLLATVTDTYGA